MFMGARAMALQVYSAVLVGAVVAHVGEETGAGPPDVTGLLAPYVEDADPVTGAYMEFMAGRVTEPVMWFTYDHLAGVPGLGMLLLGAAAAPLVPIAWGVLR